MTTIRSSGGDVVNVEEPEKLPTRLEDAKQLASHSD